VHIAYQAFGEGDIDLVVVNGFTSHVELIWDLPQPAAFYEKLGSFARVINFDRRGTGLSDPVTDAPTLEQRMDDVRAVMDAADSDRAALLGFSEGAPMSILFAATYPDRAQALVLSGGLARSTWAPDYPWASRVEDLVASGEELIGPHWVRERSSTSPRRAWRTTPPCGRGTPASSARAPARGCSASW
jgi:pimeloyl-ACP methyl ester carboxylesterase